MNLLSLTLVSLATTLAQSQVSPVVHPAVLEGPQNEVVPSLFYPSNRFGQRNRLRSRVFRDASQDTPRLFRASGRFHKRVQSATTHDIQNLPLPQDAVQIVSYKYDAEKHNEKKMANSNDVVTDAELEDHARGIERTTMSVKLREGEEEQEFRSTTPTSPTTTTGIPLPNTPFTPPVIATTQMPEHNSINEIKDIASDSAANGGALPRNGPKTFFQTVTANGNLPPQQPLALLPPQPPVVFSQPPPISPPTFTMPNLLPPQPPQPIQQQNLPIATIPHQPSNPLVQQPQFPPPPLPTPQTGVNVGLPTNPTPQSNVHGVGGVGGVGAGEKELEALAQHQLQQQQASSNHEQLGCGWDWLTNSCKDVFALNWCGKCHDFGNIFLHDCKCVAPLIPLPTTSRPSQPPPLQQSQHQPQPQPQPQSQLQSQQQQHQQQQQLPQPQTQLHQLPPQQSQHQPPLPQLPQNQRQPSFLWLI